MVIFQTNRVSQSVVLFTILSVVSINGIRDCLEASYYSLLHEIYNSLYHINELLLKPLQHVTFVHKHHHHIHVVAWVNIYGYTQGDSCIDIVSLYVLYIVTVGVGTREFCSLFIHIIFFSIHRRLDTDHTGRTWFPSSWQQGYQATNQSPLSPVLQADWFLSLQPVVECPSLTSLMPCTFDRPFIFSMQITPTCVILWDMVSRLYWRGKLFFMREVEHLNDKHFYENRINRCFSHTNGPLSTLLLNHTSY